MTLRLVIYVQLAWVALNGALGRGLFPAVTTGWAEDVVLSLIPLALFGFPVLVIFAVRRARLPAWRCWLVGSGEVALTFAYVLAMLPAI